MIQFRLHEELKKRNIRKTNFAHTTGIRPDTITAICYGNIKRVPVDILDKICQTLDCELSDIITYTRRKQP